MVVDRATDDYYRKLDIVVSGDMDIVLRQSSTGPVQSEPDLQQLKIEEEEEVEDQVVNHPLEVCVHEESEGNQRKLSEKSSSSSNGKVGIALF